VNRLSDICIKTVDTDVLTVESVPKLALDKVLLKEPTGDRDLDLQRHHFNLLDEIERHIGARSSTIMCLGIDEVRETPAL
jgi:hypothetical protein